MRRLTVHLISTILTLCVATGCATLYRDRGTFAQIDTLLESNRFEQAVELLRSEQETLYREKDLVLYYLDIGMLLHYAGDFEASNRALTLAEETIDDLFAVSISRATASLLVNDNVLDYSGEDYEDIYINVFKTLNYLGLGQPDSAFVEVRRVYEKLSLLEDKYAELASSMNDSEDAQARFASGTTRFYNSALARLMSLVMYESDGELDEAEIDLAKIDEAFRGQPEIYSFARPDLTVQAPSGPTRPVRIVGFAGLSPVKQANTFRIRTEEELLIVARTNERRGEALDVEIDRIRWKGAPPGFHFKFELPRIELRGSAVDSVSVRIDDGPPIGLSVFESVDAIALATYEVKRPLIYLKTITRTVVKGFAAERAKREITERVENPLLSLLGSIATDVAVDASEAADLRTSRFIPSRVYFVELELEQGTYDLTFEYRDSAGRLLFLESRPGVEVGNINLIDAVHLR